MLVLERSDSERVLIRVGSVDVWLKVLRASNGSVKLGFDGPREAVILREEMKQCPKKKPTGRNY